MVRFFINSSNCNFFFPFLMVFVLTCWQLNGSFYNYRMRYSTTVSNDSDTHDDFKPANKLENSGTSLANIVEQVNAQQLISCV